VRDAVFGNVGTTVAFRVGPFDAETLETVFAPQFEASDLVNLGFAQIYLTLMIDGVGSPPFSATTLPPFDTTPEDNTKKVLASSRELYARPRAEVEKAVEEWQAAEQAVVEPPKPRYGNTSAARPPAPRPASHAQASASPAPAAIVVPVPIAPAPTVVQAVRVETPAPQVHVHNHTHVERSPAPRREAPAPKPRLEQDIEKPPLEGAASLRDALAAVTAKRPEAPKPEMPKAEPHARSTPAAASSAGQQKPAGLKEALDKIAHKSPNPASLPKETLHAMLSVDPELGGSHHEHKTHHEPRG
jgi:hypothetical protein